MLNIEVFRAINAKPKRIIKKEKPKKTHCNSYVPKKENIKIVIQQIKQNKGITRDALKDKTKLRFSTLRRCLLHLINNNKLVKIKTADAGRGSHFNYYIKGEEKGIKTTREKNTETVKCEIKKHKEVRRSVVKSTLNMNDYTLNLAIKTLLEKKEITKRILYKTGNGNVYAYKAIETESNG